MALRSEKLYHREPQTVRDVLGKLSERLPLWPQHFSVLPVVKIFFPSPDAIDRNC